MRPIDIKNVKLTDPFWGRLQELVRTKMLPWQWRALNDEIPGAAKSWCIHNFRAAARLNEKRRTQPGFREPVFADPGFEVLPAQGEEADPDRFYGFVFQDTDLYKWLEAVAYSLSVHPDAELEAAADRAIGLIAAAQHPSGYLDTYYILNGMDAILTNLRSNHELYCMGHLIEAACAYYEATGKDALLKAARRFADYIYLRCGPDGDRPGFPGHEIAEMALARLYRLTGEARYLTLARLFLDRRGREPHYFDEEEKREAARRGQPWTPGGPRRHEYSQSHLPVREQREAVGHAVRAVYLYSGMADVAALTKDDSLYAACDALWHSITREKLYITGGIGGTSRGEAFSYPFDLPNDAAYAETCAAVGLVFFARRMLERAPDGEYADVMERALYNAVLSGMSLDGQSFFYVNPLEMSPEACRRDERLSHVAPSRQKWFGCACCPPNLARLIGSVAAYAFTEEEGALRLNLYIACEIKKAGLTVRVDTDMPWDGHVTLTFSGPAPEKLSLALRIPEWTDPAGVLLDCPAGVEKAARGSFVTLTGEWREGDRVSLTFPMPVRVLTADPRVRACRGKAAVARGPFVYCAEGGEPALCRLDTDRLSDIVPTPIEISGVPMAALTVPVKKALPGEALYSPYAPPQEAGASLTLIPYHAWANRGEQEMRVWLNT